MCCPGELWPVKTADAIGNSPCMFWYPGVLDQRALIHTRSGDPTERISLLRGCSLQLLRLFSFVVADLLRGTCIPRDLKLQTWRPFGAVSASKAPLQCGSSPSSLSTSFSPSCSSSDAFHNTQKCGESEGGSFFDVGHSLDQPAVSFSSLRPPLLLSEIGWCSWDAYGKHIAADSILRVRHATLRSRRLHGTADPCTCYPATALQERRKNPLVSPSYSHEYDCTHFVVFGLGLQTV